MSVVVEDEHRAHVLVVIWYGNLNPGGDFAERNQAFARAINPRVKANESWSWRMSTPGLLTHAVREYGWAFIPNQVLPPLLANIGSDYLVPIQALQY